MNYTIDLNVSSDRELMRKLCELCKKNNEYLIIADVLFQETILSSENPVRDFIRRMKDLAGAELYLKYAMGTGEVMREELSTFKAKDILDESLSSWLRESCLKLKSNIPGADMDRMLFTIAKEAVTRKQKAESARERKNRMNNGVRHVLSMFSDEYISRIRKNSVSENFKFFNSPLRDRVEKEMLIALGEKARTLPQGSYLKAYIDLYFLMILNWIAKNGVDSAAEKRFVSDVFDIEYSVTALSTNSHLISKDKRQIDLYFQYKFAVNNIEENEIKKIVGLYNYLEIGLPFSNWNLSSSGK